MCEDQKIPLSPEEYFAWLESIQRAGAAEPEAILRRLERLEDRIEKLERSEAVK